MNPEALQSIMLAVAEGRSMEVILRQIVEGIAEKSTAALVRLWLVAPGDLCAECALRSECPDQTRCLHLVASAGRSQAGDEEYSRVNGTFRRIPLGARKIGRIAATGEALLAADVKPEDPWVANPQWITTEKVRSFAGQPVVFRGEVLGVLGVFERARLAAADFEALRVFANHAAVAIANLRAFLEIDQLRHRLEQENAYLQEEIKTALDFGGLVGRSAPLQKVLQQIDLVARTEATVLILGESGVGKELIARAIHERSGRARRPLIKVNCGAIPENLFESEMFGHAKGAFTGAVKDRAGRFELADGGTLFLDEVGEIPLALQTKLLRVLQERQFERVGEDRTRHADVRIVAATNRDLKREVEAGRFRRDLFYRLSVFPIEVPPLRERRADIPLLAAHFLEQAAKKMNLKPRRLSDEQARLLSEYAWPGNIRELQNVIERAVILSQNGPLRLDYLPGAAEAPSPIQRPAPEAVVADGPEFLTRAELRQREAGKIRAALAKTHGKVFGPGGAAEALGMKGTTLASRIKALGLKRS